MDCGRCGYCAAGDRNLCPDRHLLGIGAPGGFAGCSVVPERCLFAVPEGMDPRLGALAEPLANGVHVIRQVGAARGPAVVIGAGTIGLACLQAALLGGAGPVTVVERHPRRRQHALALGARQAVADFAEVAGGAGLVVDAAGSDATRRAAVDLLGPAGTASFVGLHSDETRLPWRRIVRANIRVQGSFGYADRDFRQAVDWLAEGKATIPLSEVRPLDDGPAAFEALAAGPIDEIKIFIA